MKTNIKYMQLTPEHFDAVIALGNTVHGDNYLSPALIKDIYVNGWRDNINASWVALDTARESLDTTDPRQIGSAYLIGFRLTLAPTMWRIDKWCSPELWPYPPEDICYFKCNTVDDKYRGLGLGKSLLFKSVNSAKQQGAKAGLAHIWLASPNNSAFGYFSACGGKLIKEHANKWQIHSIEDGYDCPVCPDICYCSGAEMLLNFDDSA